MTDPFHELYEPIRPVDPDPVFARRLRARLERALALSKGLIPVPTIVPIAYRPGDVVHLALRTPDVDRTRSFYADVLGWSYLSDGRVDGSVPSIGFREGTPQITCDFAVTDLAVALDRIREAGGRAGEIERHPWGTVAECTDDQETPIRLHEVPADPDGTPPPVNGRRAGDPSYLTLEVVDSARARAFYQAVLGWQVIPGYTDGAWQVQGTAPMIGLSGGHERATVAPVWIVPDVVAAVAATRGRGGSATEPHREPYGTICECVDDQGLPFGLLES